MQPLALRSPAADGRAKLGYWRIAHDLGSAVDARHTSFSMRFAAGGSDLERRSEIFHPDQPLDLLLQKNILL